MIIILGTPGAGKTTQARLLAEYLGCDWFSMGELIRAKVTGQDREDMLAGKIISDDVTLGIIDEALKPINTKSQQVIFEGNPRSIPQAKWWLGQHEAGRFEIEAVIHLVASPAVAAKRLVNRGRLDDHDENVVETRFAEYHRSINPTLEFLKKNGVKVVEVDADGSIEEEEALIHKALGL
ncbi:MAG TPA: nucleoside monophosphate kinase [Candidatus Saccharimonadales bacterium]|nr:nucleoside monophosphate kinase [Candidatus Saccharimonadales bacterium]